MTRTCRVAIDVGGTFTDVVGLIPETGALIFDKVATTPDFPTRGVLNAFEQAGAAMDEVATFSHGTTLGLNALLTRNGARTAVISTRGFRDVYLLGRTDRRVNYDITYRKPIPLLERYDTFEVTERSLADGSVHTPFDVQDARTTAQRIAERGYESVAVSFLHAYANPQHELRMREVLAEVAPDVAVTLSHELSREYREYERTSTAVLDAYIKPIVRTYLEILEKELAAGGFEGRFLMTRSGGGAMTARSAREQPVNLILSGPAGGVIGAAALSRLIDQPNMITIDMGGTSLDASLIIDSEPVLQQGAEFEEMPINTPSLYIHSIGMGGGSVAWLDEAGALQVGPQSAGASPGPASYGRGGTVPTFTDAALTLGYLGSDSRLGGKLTLDAAVAEEALQPVAKRLGLSARALARGIVQISTMKIMGAVRAITVDLGRDPRDFALLSSGGGGGLVAVEVAQELGIPTVIVPPGQGAFSAFGMLMADIQHDFSRTNLMPLASLQPKHVEAAYRPMEEKASALLEQEGFGADRRTIVRMLDVRYAGQEHAVTVPHPTGAKTVAAIEAAFTELHERQYGHVMDDPVEITTLRVRALGHVDKPVLPLIERRTDGLIQAIGTRSVYLSEDRPAVEYDLYVRETLLAGDAITGPAVITEHTATTVIHDGDRLEVGPLGEMVISLSHHAAKGQR
ncbi:hydantoinase/oxoprolinase family protein [Kitasatospora sp. NBC_00240]|uniref:hydantoinase/oxoprolinase family protein n=1 Tax=Kitasatospora sp. NBC_00240 TaxID=2903567 RepID=UPI0022511D82|nr:hydantoinase/oxoprolinase family protein [Kitasatospora sp. NBC_00240]MCX5215484.1 hydantoinase/oxoprolinase family protein [Kitasatospora sp. NBC_00240]